MFQLIVAVISIALVAALAIASIFYGGKAWHDYQFRIKVATLINQAHQIEGAIRLYEADTGGKIPLTEGQFQTNISDPLKILYENNYLSKSIPPDFGPNITDRVAHPYPDWDYKRALGDGTKREIVYVFGVANTENAMNFCNKFKSELERMGINSRASIAPGPTPSLPPNHPDNSFYNGIVCSLNGYNSTPVMLGESSTTGTWAIRFIMP